MSGLHLSEQIYLFMIERLAQRCSDNGDPTVMPIAT